MKAFPFDSRITGYEENGMPIYDRASSAADFAQMLNSFFTDGVFDASMCSVLAGDGLNVTVGAGSFLIQGRYGFIETPETVPLEASDKTYNRIDTVVLRRDLSSEVNNIVLSVIKGTPAESPSAPALTNDGTIWELGLSDVLRPANSTTITQANITDTRLDPERCGIVAAVLTDIDTSEFLHQFSALIVEMQETIQSVYEGVEKVNILERSATLLASGWSAEAPYTQTVSADGVLASDSPFVDLNLAAVVDAEEMSALADAWSLVLKATSGAGTLTATASDVPEVDIPIKIKVVR